MLQKTISTLLCALILAGIPGLTPGAIAQVIAPGAAAVPAGGFNPAAPLFRPASTSDGDAFQAFGRWLGGDDGRGALSLNPSLAELQKLDFGTEAGRMALAPMLARLPSDFSSRLSRIGRLTPEGREIVLAQLFAAQRAAVPEVEARAAAVMVRLNDIAYTGKASTEQLSAFAAQLETLRFYGDTVKASGELVRRTVAALRERRTLAAAGEDARRLGAPRDPGAAPDAPAEPAKRPRGLKLPVRTFKLDNGLTVVVSPDHASPTAAVSITYRVGSQDERKGLSGFAHLFEHLMFQGTKNLKPSEFSDLIMNSGGVDNAYTTKTNTTYHDLVPKSALARTLWAEADRMQTLDVNARALAVEKQVVLEEMRLSYLNQPYRLGQDAGMSKAAFSKWENQHTTIGEMEDIRNASLDDVRAFYMSHYAPNNAVLTVAGDVTPAEAKRLAKRYFGPIPARKVAPRPDLSEPPLAADKQVEIPDELAQLPRALVGWRAPTRGTKGFWAVALIAEMLSGEDQNPLYQALVNGAKTALSAGAGFPWWSNHFNMRGPDLFGLDIMLKPGSSLPVVLAAADRVLARYAAEGPTGEELARVKAQAEFQWLNALQSVHERAKTLSSYAALIGDPKNLRKDLRKLLSITPADVRRAAKRYILGQKRSVVHIVPTAPTPHGEDAEAPPTPAETPRAPGEAPPPLAPQKPVPIPELHRFTLSNGLKVLLARDSRFPLLEARLSIPAGRSGEASGEEGLSEAAAALMLKGAGGKDGAAIAKAFSRLGYGFRVRSGPDRMTIDAGGLERNAGGFFGQLAEVLADASYPAGEVALWKDNAIESLQALRADSGFLMDEQVKKELFPGHPYGKPSPDEATLAGLTRERLTDFHRRAVTPEGATMVLVGDLGAEEARKMLESALSRWRGGQSAAEVPPLPDSGGSRLIVVDRPGSQQADLAMHQTILLARKDPDFLAFQVMNFILGGGVTGRLFANLRTDKGYTYGSYSSIDLLKRGAAWSATAQTRNEVALQALREMLKEIERLRDEPVSEETLAATKRQLAGRFAIRLASMESTADVLGQYEQQGLDPAAELRGYLGKLEALTPADIQRVARTYLRPEKLVTVVVGDKRTLDPLLAPLGRR